jgi:hypothetical protein
MILNSHQKKVVLRRLKEVCAVLVLGTLNETPAQIRVISNTFLTMMADESADRPVLCLAWQGTGLRNRRFYCPHGRKRIQSNSDLVPFGSLKGKMLNIVMEIDFKKRN